MSETLQHREQSPLRLEKGVVGQTQNSMRSLYFRTLNSGLVVSHDVLLTGAKIGGAAIGATYSAVREAVISIIKHATRKTE